jgi:hypothetical protein
MLRALTKTVMFALLLTALSSTVSRAEVKIYQYDGKLPFVQMMLNMMVAMGVLDRIPGHLVYGNGPYGYGSRSSLSNPYLRALAMRGYPVSGLTGNSLYGRSPGLNSPGFGSPWTSSPWMSSPWTGSGFPYGSGFGTPWSGSWLDSDSVWGDSFGWPDRYGYLGGGPYGYGPYGAVDNLDRAVLWNSPTWGVLPVDELSMGDIPEGSPWQSDDLQAWANEPWSDADPADWSQPVPGSQYGSQYGSPSGSRPGSRYGQPARSPMASLPQQTQQAPQQPIVLNNIITTGPASDTASTPAGTPAQPDLSVPRDASREVQSPLAKLGAGASADKRQDKRLAEPVSEKSRLQASPLYKYSEQAQKYVLANPQDEQHYESQLQYKKVMPPAMTKRKQKDDKLCITEHCGLKKPDINGLWVSQDGEMLGIRSDRYLWTDGVSRYLTGRMKVTNEYLLTNVEGYDTIMRFKYKLANDYLLTMQEDGTIREFVRVTDLNRSRQMYY